jgi:hypothetical protein
MAAAEFTEFGTRCLKPALVEIDGGDMGPGASKTCRNGAANAAAAPGHDANAAGQAKPVG